MHCCWILPGKYRFCAMLTVLGCSSSSQELFPEALRGDARAAGSADAVSPTASASQHAGFAHAPAADAEIAVVDAGLAGGANSPAPISVDVQAISVGTNAEGAELLEMGELELAGLGAAQLRIDDRTVFWGTGGVNQSSRGIHVIVLDPVTGEPRPAVCPQAMPTQLDCTPAATPYACSFDLFCGRQSGEQDETRRLSEYLASVPTGDVVAVMVADDAGLTRFLGETVEGKATHVCDPLKDELSQRLRTQLQELGARRLEEYCYRDSWAFISVKGKGLVVEQLDKSAPAYVSVGLPVLD